jgi:LysR family transcriptional regulator for bpeEF and oprC
MDRLANMRLFIRIVETGSFSRAAESCRISRATATERIAALERQVDVRLLNRTRRSVSPTPEGMEFLELCRRVLEDIERVEADLGKRVERPSGTLRVSLNVAIGRCLILPRLQEFLAACPDVRPEIVLTDGRADFVTDGIDVAVRIGGLENQDLVMRALGKVKRVTVASPDYIARHGIPATPQDIERHRAVDFLLPRGRRRLEWEFEQKKKVNELHFNGYLAVNDGIARVEAAAAGLGIAQTLSFVAKPYLETGRLTRLFPEQETFAPPISALYARSRHMPARIRAFVDFAARTVAAVRDD